MINVSPLGTVFSISLTYLFDKSDKSGTCNCIFFSSNCSSNDGLALPLFPMGSNLKGGFPNLISTPIFFIFCFSNTSSLAASLAKRLLSLNRNLEGSCLAGELTRIISGGFHLRVPFLYFNANSLGAKVLIHLDTESKDFSIFGLGTNNSDLIPLKNFCLTSGANLPNG